MTNYDTLIKQLEDIFFQRVQRKIEYRHGLLGDGRGQVKIPGSPNFSYVRPDKTSDHFVKMFNMNVTGQDGDPVIYGELPWQPGLTQVISFDWEAYKEVDGGWGDTAPNISSHGATHQWNDNLIGLDSFHVFRRQLGDLKLFPVSEVSGVSVRMSPYSFIYQGSRYTWEDDNQLDMTPAIPTATGTAAWALVYWDIENDSIGAVTGTTKIAGSLLDNDKPVAPDGVIPSGYIKMLANVSNITSYDMYGAREPFHPQLYYGTGTFGVNAAQIPIFDDLMLFTGTSTVEGALAQAAQLPSGDLPYRIAGAVGVGGAKSQPVTGDSVSVTDPVQFKPNVLIGGADGDTPVTTLSVVGVASSLKSDFTNKVTSSHFLIEADYTADNYMPGMFWRTPNNNAARPKAGIFLRTEASGSVMTLGTSDDYSSGITKEAVIIDWGGRVGVGTTSPQRRLHVANGNGTVPSLFGEGLLIQNNDDATDQARLYLLAGNSGTSVIDFADEDSSVAGQFRYSHGNNSLIIRTNGTDRLQVDGSGNVSINTTDSPGRLTVDDAAGGSTPNIRIRDGSSTRYRSDWSMQTGGGGASLNAYDDTGAAYLPIRIDANDLLINTASGGDVGIGTASPQMKLHVAPSAGSVPTLFNDGILIQNNSSASDSARLVILAGASGSSIINFGDTNSSIVGHIHYVHSLNEMRIRTNSADRLYINSSGQFGFGASSPGSLMELNLATEDLEIVDAGSSGATEQDWIEVRVGGDTGYIRVYATA